VLNFLSIIAVFAIWVWSFKRAFDLSIFRIEIAIEIDKGCSILSKIETEIAKARSTMSIFMPILCRVSCMKSTKLVRRCMKSRLKSRLKSPSSLILSRLGGVRSGVTIATIFNSRLPQRHGFYSFCVSGN
jgi:hypothetical protein